MRMKKLTLSRGQQAVVGGAEILPQRNGTIIIFIPPHMDFKRSTNGSRKKRPHRRRPRPQLLLQTCLPADRADTVRV
ncbi:hypothetical protein COW95_04385 [Candidatus Peregrinibacteria bacterium CG22_combo_CG10-13_8_21_14_all_49_11]|nr:MAG: hypothetical protein COW95_04385 [Candidatus Peregrinibacteria bacterium CG22_combo_CG10-13_8_21_14_all_49_11]